MSKAYSNKALPPGTILREWRLEEVLGVGGFGIVYRARGIYFDELVAIKEYFPSSISERDDEDTVVPIDSDAEEVHALGLKKFVEEAKLLWNLSTPSRHPNIVSVRSLFEIHGTAYMVMDFEDGISLSKLLKQGRRFNERSLLAIIRPVAEGLDRAHRVGVLHRDIKPANILINDSGRPVLIDFGSARFEAAEATSTKVTFHTPPYAALEQYVKTLDQGPWTDIYALGVVMYECVTGEKPPEVLERMHGGKDQALATGRWPGYSKRFLAAVDAAMAIRPQDRPQTISDWLALIDGKAGNHSSTIEIDEDATRVAAYDMAAEQIMPVGAATAKPLDTGVPATPKDARFKRAGGDTGTARKLTGSGDPPRRGRPRKPVPEPEVAAQAAPRPGAPDGTAKRRLSPLVAGGGALALVLVGAAGWLATRDPGQDRLAEGPAAAVQAAAPGTSVGAGASAAAVQSLLQDARAAGAPAPLVTSLAATAAQLDGMQRQLGALLADPARNNEAPALATRMDAIARDAGVRFAAGLLADSQEAGRRLAADVPWAAVPARAGTAERRQAATAIGTASAALQTAAQPASPPRTATDAIAAAREALAQWQRFVGGVTTAYRLQAVPVIARPDRQAMVERGAAERAAPAPALPAAQQARTSSQPAAPAPEPVSAAPVADASLSRFNAIVDEGRSMARQVIRMGERSRGGSSPEERAAHELRRSNAQLARGYDSYLAKLRDSMRGVSTDREAQRLIKDASQTRAYVQFLVKRSSESLNP